MAREGDTFNVGLNLNLSTTDVKSNRMVVFTPILVGEKDTVSLSSVGLLGRRRFIFDGHFQQPDWQEHARAGVA